MKVLVLGNGFISQHLPYPIINERIIPDNLAVKLLLQAYKPDVLINCIGKTGRPNVDWCESHQSETFMANVIIPGLLAHECEKLGIRLIHIGSGCVYFGQSPNMATVESDWEGLGRYHPIEEDSGWKEIDFANPQSYYSKTKYACDLIIGSLSHVTTLRIRMPISSKNDPRNFINKVRGYNQVIDIPNSVTFIDDLVRCVDWAIHNNKTGIYHVVNPQPLTAAQVMKEYKKHVPEHKFSIISEKELNAITIAKRSNCILNSDKLKQDGFIMTPTWEALQNCMNKYIKNI